MANMLQFLRMKNLYGQPDPGMIDPSTMDPATMDSMGPDPNGIMSNMFQPQSDDAGNTFVGPINKPGGVNPAIAADSMQYDAGQRMRDLYKPESGASDKFNEMVGQYPRREDNHPSMLRKIGGALTAVGGSFNQRGRFQTNPDAIGMGMSLVDKPFTDKLTDWKNQIGPTQTAANLERQTNVNERSMAYQTVAQELRQHAQETKDKNDTHKLEISENRAKVYEFKAHNPGAKFDFSGPTVKVADPISGKVTDTGIDTGHMSKLDQMNLAQDFTRENIGTRGEEAANLENVKERNRQKDITSRGEQARTTKGVPSGSSAGGKPESPSQTRVRQFNAARELSNTDSSLRQFIKMGSGSDFTIIAPSEGMFGHRGPTPEQYKKIKDSIYGNTPMTPIASHNSTTPSTEDGRVKITDMTGKVIGTIPSVDVVKLDKTKYKVAQ